MEIGLPYYPADQYETKFQYINHPTEETFNPLRIRSYLWW